MLLCLAHLVHRLHDGVTILDDGRGHLGYRSLNDDVAHHAEAFAVAVQRLQRVNH